MCLPLFGRSWIRSHLGPFFTFGILLGPRHLISGGRGRGSRSHHKCDARPCRRPFFAFGGYHVESLVRPLLQPRGPFWHPTFVNASNSAVCRRRMTLGPRALEHQQMPKNIDCKVPCVTNPFQNMCSFDGIPNFLHVFVLGESARNHTTQNKHWACRDVIWC